MNVIEACQAVLDARQRLAPDAVLVATMSAMFAFDHLGAATRRIDSVPLMGGTAGLALGLSLARPELAVIAVDGDASLLMELGGLVTVANARPRHLVHLVVNNGVQFGGIVNMQRPGIDSAASCDFVAMAKAAGYARAVRVDTPQALAMEFDTVLRIPQLAFVELRVQADPAAIGSAQPQPYIPDRQFERMRDAVVQLRAELGTRS